MDKKSSKKSAQLPLGAGRSKVKSVIAKAVGKQKPSPSKASKGK